MIRTVINYHLLRLSRDHAVRRVGVGYLLVLMVFSAWGLGERLASDGTTSVALLKASWQRAWTGLLLPLTLLTPWLVMRHMTAPSHADRVRFIAQAGLAPWQAVLGNLLALYLCLLQLMFLSLPVMIFIDLFGALSSSELGGLYVLLCIWLLLALLIALSWRLYVDNGLGALMGSYFSILVLGISCGSFLYHTTHRVPVFLLLVMAAASLGAVVLGLSNRKLSYMKA